MLSLCRFFVHTGYLVAPEGLCGNWIKCLFCVNKWQITMFWNRPTSGQFVLAFAWFTNLGTQGKVPCFVLNFPKHHTVQEMGLQTHPFWTLQCMETQKIPQAPENLFWCGHPHAKKNLWHGLQLFDDSKKFLTNKPENPKRKVSWPAFCLFVFWFFFVEECDSSPPSLSDHAWKNDLVAISLPSPEHICRFLKKLPR